AIQNIKLTDKELEIYKLSEKDWNYLQKIFDLMKHFKKGTDYIKGHLYPTLTFSVPVYNYLINRLEKIIDILDSRLKIGYYIDNKWETKYITAAKEIITNIWNENYKDKIPNTYQQQKRISSKKDELECYLNKPIIKDQDIDVLLWWK
ncbi:6975_t:CDS:2, partial [Dentiscutata erythropus]